MQCCYCEKQIDVSVSCVCPDIDNDYTDDVGFCNVMMHFMIIDRTDA